MLGGLLPILNGSFETFVKSAGGVFYYDARKDYITANGITLDRSGQVNNITWNNFSGDSGLIIEDGKIFRRLDGTDDFGSIVNSTSIDVIIAPLGVFSTLRVPNTAIGVAYLLAKSASTAGLTDQQYSTYFPSKTQYQCILEGAIRGQSASFSNDVFINIGWIWNGTTIKYYLNLVNGGTNGSYTGSLTSKSFIRIGCRTNSIDGTSNTAFQKLDLCTKTIYAGTEATELKILKSEGTISKAYI